MLFYRTNFVSKKVNIRILNFSKSLGEKQNNKTNLVFMFAIQSFFYSCFLSKFPEN